VAFTISVRLRPDSEGAWWGLLTDPYPRSIRCLTPYCYSSPYQINLRFRTFGHAPHVKYVSCFSAVTWVRQSAAHAAEFSLRCLDLFMFAVISNEILRYVVLGALTGYLFWRSFGCMSALRARITRRASFVAGGIFINSFHKRPCCSQ
jgi:hypothetical protein